MPQWADDSMTPSPISVSRDKYGNEIPTDQPKHDNSTPAMGAFSYDEGHYSTDFGAGFGSYGVNVPDKGQNTDSQSMDVNVRPSNRGKES